MTFALHRQFSVDMTLVIKQVKIIVYLFLNFYLQFPFFWALVHQGKSNDYGRKVAMS